MYFKDCCNFVNVIWNTLKFWLNNDNNDNFHAGAKFDASGGAETSFLLTMTLSINTMAQRHIRWRFKDSCFRNYAYVNDGIPKLWQL